MRIVFWRENLTIFKQLAHACLSNRIFSVGKFQNSPLYKITK